MPFTPLHMGPGIVVKAMLQGSFSLMVFGWAQILMDLQPLFVIITGEGHLHGFSHTYAGATLIAIPSALTGKYLSEVGLNQDRALVIRWPVAFLSAFIGTVMPAGLRDFRPRFHPGNKLRKRHSTCAVSN